MEDRASMDKDVAEARERVHTELAHITKQIRDYQLDPQATIEALDVAPHLANRR